MSRRCRRGKGKQLGALLRAADTVAAEPLARIDHLVALAELLVCNRFLHADAEGVLSSAVDMRMDSDEGGGMPLSADDEDEGGGGIDGAGPFWFFSGARSSKMAMSATAHAVIFAPFCRSSSYVMAVDGVAEVTCAPPPPPPRGPPVGAGGGGGGVKSKKKISRAKLADVAPRMLARQATSMWSNLTTDATSSAFMDDLESRTPFEVMKSVAVGFLSLRTHDSADGTSRVRMAADGAPTSWHRPPGTRP